jgi:AraC family transcriptional regulator
MQKGWNVKYKKGGRALCTLYPMAGHFLALVVIGQREEQSMPDVLPELKEETQALYHRTPSLMGGRWLMLNIADDAALQDLISLVRLRAK